MNKVNVEFISSCLIILIDLYSIKLKNNLYNFDKNSLKMLGHNPTTLDSYNKGNTGNQGTLIANWF